MAYTRGKLHEISTLGYFPRRELTKPGQAPGFSFLEPPMRLSLPAAVVAAGLCLIVAGVAVADVREPVPVSTRYTARRGSTNLPAPQPTSLEECRARIRAAYDAEGETRTTGSIVYQCITTESYIVAFHVDSRGTVTLSWTPPTQQTDGTALTDLAGYRVEYGSSPTDLNQTIQVPNPGLSSYRITDLSPGTWYFAVRSYSTAGKQSGPSNVAVKTVQ